MESLLQTLDESATKLSKYYYSLLLMERLSGKQSAWNAGDQSLIPGWGRSTGGGNGNPLQFSCLGNPMDRGASWATVHGVAKSQTQLSNFHFTSLHFFVNGNDPENKLMKLSNHIATRSFLACFYFSYEISEWPLRKTKHYIFSGCLFFFSAHFFSNEWSKETLVEWIQIIKTACETLALNFRSKTLT